MAIGDIYILKMFQTLYSQQMLNVWFYEQVTAGTVDDAEGLFEAFDSDILVEWAGVVTSQVDVTRVEVFNPEIPTDFFDGTPTNNQGTRAAGAGTRSSSYVAAGFRSNRAGPGSRASYKRFSGLSETDMDANSLQASFLDLPAVGNLQAAMANVIELSGADSSYKPIQVKHPVPLGIPVVVNFGITSWSVPYLTSQVSRRAPAGT